MQYTVEKAVAEQPNYYEGIWDSGAERFFIPIQVN